MALSKCVDTNGYPELLANRCNPPILFLESHLVLENTSKATNKFEQKVTLPCGFAMEKDSQADGDKDVSERTCRIASKFLKRCSQSARLWHSLINCPSVAKRLRQSLQAEVVEKKK